MRRLRLFGCGAGRRCGQIGLMSRGTVLRVLTTFVAVSVFSFGACSGERGPPGGDTRVPDLAEAASTAAGMGGMGGTAPVLINTCPCIVSAIAEDSDCLACTNELVQTQGGDCNTIDEECENDPGCKAVISCTIACRDDLTTPLEDCIYACAYPQDRDEATLLYHRRWSCFCTFCSEDCHADGPEMCAAPGGAGGTGGTGGAGGQGGSGG